jgi:hypothetical protein
MHKKLADKTNGIIKEEKYHFAHLEKFDGNGKFWERFLNL